MSASVCDYIVLFVVEYKGNLGLGHVQCLQACEFIASKLARYPEAIGDLIK